MQLRRSKKKIPLFLEVKMIQNLKMKMRQKKTKTAKRDSKPKKEPQDNLNMAHRLIKYWVADVEALYDQKSMTFNVHIFSHFAENVSRWGPAWAVSTYCFESAIGKLKNILHAHRGVPHQIHRQLSYNQARNILSNTCSTPRTDIFIENIKSKPNKMTRFGFPASSTAFIEGMYEQLTMAMKEHDSEIELCAAPERHKHLFFDIRKMPKNVAVTTAVT
ncbi:hypothetical protein FOCC_FOCC013294 [Frankliniella occidentalis]|nr:hypothetical protein FOCC_FOCC013294 [Frankliniella occidentalis]